jgi:hypothetical protein
VGIKNVEGQKQQRADDLNDVVATTAGTFLGITLGCARCHDHKFDPVTQADYYALSAVFSGVKHGERPLMTADWEERLRREPAIRAGIAALDGEIMSLLLAAEPAASLETPGGDTKRSMASPLGNIDRFEPVTATGVRFVVLSTNGSEPCLDELEAWTDGPTPRNVALASDGAKASASSVYANGQSEIHQIAHVNDGRYGNSCSWISAEPGAGFVQVEWPQPVTVQAVTWARDRQGKYSDRLATRYRIEAAVSPGEWRIVATGDDRQEWSSTATAGTPESRLSPDAADRYARLKAERDALALELPGAADPPAYLGRFETPEPTFRLHRGDPMQPRESIAPGAVAALGNPLALSSDAGDPERRMALAEWLGSEGNPRTARVIANRLWHYHFGQALNREPGDLGWNGGLPSHPRLLDWLASELPAQGRSLKAMHRMIVLSSVYRQSSAKSDAGLAADAQNRLLWRYSPRRLEAEPIRDSILAASGSLDPRMGGPGYDAFEPNTNYVKVYNPKTRFGPSEWRRMVYQSKPRMVQDATFGAFDCPDASRSLHRRMNSTTPLQALNLLNSPFVVEQARLFAARLARERPEGPREQVELGFLLAFGRPPDDAEMDLCQTLVREHGLSALCLALFNANEFVHLD